MNPKPITTFRAYCENKSLYLRVVVWRTLKDFRTANPGCCRALGLCRAFRVKTIEPLGSARRDRFKPILGEIHLAASRLTTGIITHEAAHGMFAWAEEVKCIPLFQNASEREASKQSRNGTMLASDPEERCCYVLGNLVRQIVFTLYRKKILK